MVSMHFVFDLDGTLSNPYAGIENGFRYALKKLEHSHMHRNHFRDLIGSPLPHSFSEILLLNPRQAIEAIDLFREYYSETGWKENELYSGIDELLSALKKKNNRLSLLTNKPEIFAKKIVNHFGIEKYFENVIGQALNYTSLSKISLLKNLLKNSEGEKTFYVGDTTYDIEACKCCDIPVIAVGYGFGNYEDLLKMEPDYYVSNVTELKDCLLKLTSL